MKRSLYRFLALCTRKELIQFWLLLGLGILIALLEVAGVASILPFLELASNPDALADNPRLKAFYDLVGFSSENQMIVAVAWMALIFMALANSLAVLSIWFQQKIAWSVSHNVSMRLVRTYMVLPYEFFLNKDSSDLIRSAIDDIRNLIEGIVLAGCRLISQLLVASLIFVLLLIVHPYVALAAVAAIGSIYLVIVYSRRVFLINLGKESLQTTSDRYRTFVDIISGIKAIKSNGAKDYFVDRFEKPSRRYSKIRPLIQITYSIPRYLVETLAFGTVVFIVLFLANSKTGFVDSLPTLTLFTLAGYRLIPAIHGAYVSFAQMLNSYPAIDNIHNDIHAAIDNPVSDPSPVLFERSINISSVSFAYPEFDTPVIDNISIEIIKGQKVALVGPSGSGKTTLVDLIMGLLEPTSGSIVIDDMPLEREQNESWRKHIGYVPQDVFLYNDTIACNIAFGEDDADEQRVKKAARMAQIGDFIETQLPNQYETLIGERGVRLSGGQRQRLGLARALYRQPDVLVLDEATSALDNVTEGDVVRAIHDEVPNVTIIMIAHRISTVIRCDKLYAIDHGKVVAEGNYKELIDRSELFRDLARFD